VCLYRKAAELGGSAESLNSLADMHDRGDAVEHNHQKAAELIVSAIKTHDGLTLKLVPSGHGAWTYARSWSDS
jgi:hypothetical protein